MIFFMSHMYVYRYYCLFLQVCMFSGGELKFLTGSVCAIAVNLKYNHF